MALKIAHNSPQRRAHLHRGEEGKVYFGTRPLFTLPPHPSDTFHTVTESDRFDCLAHRYLGDASLFWVIMELNGIAWPLSLPVGETIRIPDKSRLTPEVLKRAGAFPTD
jgi:nucleoid-associated protein YgaU